VTSVPPSVARVLDRALEQRPDAEGGLWELGVRPGDRVAATLPNDLDVVVAFHAVMRLGAIWVGIPDALAVPEKDRLLQHCRPRAYLCESVAAEGLGAAGHHAPAVHIDPHAAAGIAYTSGTTGTPKGVVHSQHNLVLPGVVLAATRGYGPELRKGDCLPLTILNTMVLTTLLTAQAGGCCVVMDRRDAQGVVEWICREQLTVWNGVPTQLRDLLHRSDIDRTDLASLTEVWCGGADLPDSLRTEFLAKFGLPVRATYGLTEAPTVVAMDPPGARWHPGASGIALPHLDVHVDDGELTVTAATGGRWAHRRSRGRRCRRLGSCDRPPQAADRPRRRQRVPDRGGTRGEDGAGGARRGRLRPAGRPAQWALRRRTRGVQDSRYLGPSLTPCHATRWAR
jgi:long-chain acyl-CoA synthetase